MSARRHAAARLRGVAGTWPPRARLRSAPRCWPAGVSLTDCAASPNLLLRPKTMLGFLPRAMLPASPFRFLVIDNPVQAMDPAKVDGLARVLEKTAADRQVIVFTHDNRLAQAVRQLSIPAAILEVTRRPGSAVEVRTCLDPAEQALRDAGALAADHLLTGDARRLVDKIRGMLS